jgi:ribosomal protein S18 acetylase RimI-like enzyme
MIRTCQPHERDRIFQIALAAFSGLSIEERIEHALFLPKDSWQELRCKSIADFLDQAAQVFVFEEEGQVLGYIILMISGKVGRIANLAVDPAFHKRGIGRALINHALTYFRQQGLELVRIETNDENSVSQHLYPELGFVEAARQIHYAMKLE